MQKALEELLSERNVLLNKLNRQEEKLDELDAYKRTIIKSLTVEDLFLGLPSNFENQANFSILQVDDQYPLFILNPGNLQYLKQDQNNTEDIVPVNFKALRWFKKTKASKRTGEGTWYTSTIHKKDDKYYFIIKDDENNTWKGQNAFYEFSKCFEHAIPFKNVDEWIGLNKEAVKLLIKTSQKEYEEKCEMRAQK
ncbi:hypothetical protein GINT2_000163 [Glugoides intestinalis]